ncbi:MAG: MltA domain-containing protein [Thermodesulfobacteriota bacterium]|nr:MltA domain-containing protein [Thermodesulfobacteriota bacterium]
MIEINHYCKKFIILIFVFTFLGCFPALRKEAERPEQALRHVDFFYPRFLEDMDFSSLALALRRNLQYLNRVGLKRLFHYGPHVFTGRQVRDSQEFFLNFILKNPDSKELTRMIREHFLVYRAAGRAGNRHVLYTGYFEPVYEGRLTPDERYKYPIYRKPDDLIKIDLSLFNEKFDGKSITARIEEKKVLPYYSRKQIEKEKVLEGKKMEIAWLRDPIDVAFLHIQGSGRLRLQDGRTISVGYQAANGRPYKSIGRYMIEKGFISKEQMSMQSIRSYLSEHPEIVEEVLNHNPSYIFFRLLNDGPFGNINVPLTPGRSLALDFRLFPKGALCYISSRKPVVNNRGEITGWTNFSRFALNQDTGGAIRGAGRADIFWGNDKYAELAAGHMKHEGELFILIKKP